MSCEIHQSNFCNLFVLFGARVEMYGGLDIYSPSPYHEMGVTQGGACGVMVIVVGNGRGDKSSNLGRD